MRAGTDVQLAIAAASGNIGNLHREAGRPERALPLLADAYTRFGALYRSQPQLHALQDAYYKAIWNYGDALWRVRNHTELAARAEELVQEFPEELRAYVEAYAFLNQAAELAGAERDSAPPDPAAPKSAAANYRARAKGLLRASASASRVTPFYQESLAWHLLIEPDHAARDAPRALRLVEQALARAPSEAGAHWTHAFALCANGRHDEALASLRRSIEMNGKEDDMDWLLLAMIAARRGALEEAQGHFARPEASYAEHSISDEYARRFLSETAAVLQEATSAAAAVSATGD